MSPRPRVNSREVDLAARRMIDSARRLEEIERSGTVWESDGEGAGGGGSAGVSSVAKSGSTPLTGDVTLSAGSNVTLTQTGQDIAIAASGGGAVDTWDQYAMFRSSAYMSSGGGTYLQWGSAIASNGSPAPSLNPATARSILLNSAGVFRVEMTFWAYGTSANDIVFTLSGGADSGTFEMLSSGVDLAPYTATYEGCIGTLIGWVKSSGGTGANVAVSPYTPGTAGTPDATLTVTKIGPYA